MTELRTFEFVANVHPQTSPPDDGRDASVISETLDQTCRRLNKDGPHTFTSERKRGPAGPATAWIDTELIGGTGYNAKYSGEGELLLIHVQGIGAMSIAALNSMLPEPRKPIIHDVLGKLATKYHQNRFRGFLSGWVDNLRT